MASTSFPSGSPRVVSDDQHEILSAAWSYDGLVGALGDTPLVYADSSGRQVKFRAGKYGVVHGKGWSSGATDIVKTVTANASGQPRIDLAVLGLDRSTWLATEYIKAGTAASVPVAPALQRDAMGAGTGKWEWPVALVAVAAGAALLNPADVTPIQAYVGGGQLVVPDVATLGRLPTNLAYGTVVSVVDQPYLYSSVGWRRADWYTAWGAAAPVAQTSLAGTPGAATPVRDAVLGNVVFTAVAGRMYDVEVNGLELSGTVGEVYQYTLKDGGSLTPVPATANLTAPLLWRCQATGGPGQEAVAPLKKRITLSAGTHTIALFTAIYSGSHAPTPISERQIVVTDVGPAV